jgi:hypothetical protein
MTRQEIAEARRHPGPVPTGWNSISPALLRQTEDQTVVSLAAVLAVLGSLDDREPACFDRWGILAASRYLGRSGLVRTIAGFQDEGVWSVSPHLIPHLTLHSPAGTISLALGIHGPNLGIGGGPGAGFECFLTALTWLSTGRVPGLWLVLSGWSPEFVPDRQGEPLENCECQALAMALVPSGATGYRQTEMTLTESLNPRPARPLDLHELDSLLRQGRSSRAGRTSGSGRLAHEGHTNSAIPRHHLDDRGGLKLRRRAIAVDVTGKLRIELGE